MSQMAFTLNENAPRKISYHALKYSSQGVIGLLIADSDNIVDALPLFHEQPVGPTLDAAFHLITDVYLDLNPS